MTIIINSLNYDDFLSMPGIVPSPKDTIVKRTNIVLVLWSFGYIGKLIGKDVYILRMCIKNIRAGVPG